MRRVAAALMCLLAGPHAALAADAPPKAALAADADPNWAADVLGSYYGTVFNAGHMTCQHTLLSLQDGHLVGHYWIADVPPFEGTLTQFKPASDTSGTFIWTDRYGTGVEFLVFASDRSGFVGSWGSDRPDPFQPVYGQRTAPSDCNPQTSAIEAGSSQG